MHWNKKFIRPLYVNFIPNQPEIRINIFTQTIEADSKKVLVHAFIGLEIKSLYVGASKTKKSAWTINTKNIAMIRNNSMLDWRGPLVIEDMFLVINQIGLLYQGL